ncbi:MAG: flagellar type III secretion system pore protein FliP [Fimbriimonas sp.]|jgi:flagellar biosynthetic protein FliP|nr:flagellar type III secretion system pore protein FliP [Fimbriimonas sp.]
MKKLLWIILVLGLVGIASAQAGIPSISIGLGAPQSGAKINPSGNNNEVATSLQILAMLTVLSLAPALMILTTAFTRIVIIFSFIRTALGTPTIPPNQVVIGLSLFLTFYVMGPTWTKVNDTAVQPYFASKGKMSQKEALERASGPVRDFMLKNTYEKDLKLFLDIRKEKPATKKEVSLTSLVPAFVISELKTAFIVGFYIFIPFLIIDLVVASGLMSMGMMMLPPSIVSLPAKLLVFVLADGWGTLVSAILAGYR